MTKDRTKLAVLIGSPLGGLKGVDTDIKRIRECLEARTFECTECVGKSATRARILVELEQLRDRAQAGYAIVVYYSGHGGRCYLDGGGDRAHNYLVPMDHDRGKHFRGVMDFELAPIFYDISKKTRNVTVILDCCHASTMVRDDMRRELFRAEQGFEPQPEERLRSWEGEIRYAMPEDMSHRLVSFSKRASELYPDSNPHVVRIVATASGAPAFEFKCGETYGGYLTAELCKALNATILTPISWDSIIRRVREKIIARRDSTTQRPELEGPLSRLPFSLGTVADIVGRTTLVHRQSDQTCWVRAGRLQGLFCRDTEIEDDEADGDELLVLAANEGKSHEISGIARATVVKLFDDCAKVRLRNGLTVANGQRQPSSGSLVVFSRLQQNRKVWVDPSAKALGVQEGEIRQNVRLRWTENRDEAMFRIIGDGYGLRLEGPPGLHRIAAVADDERRHSRLLFDLDDVARGSILEDVLASPPGIPDDLTWSVEFLIKPWGSSKFRALVDGERVKMGSRVRFRLQHLSRAMPTLYVNVLDRGVSRRIVLLNPSQPAGVQLNAPERPSPATVAWVPGSTEDFKIVWPKDVPRISGLTEEYIVVVSERPLDLRSLLKVDDASRGLGAGELDGQATRCKGLKETEDVREKLPDTHPDASLGTPLNWAVERVGFELVP